MRGELHRRQWPLGIDIHQLVRRRDRQRPEQQRVSDGEDRRVEADAKPERQHGNRGESRAEPQPAGGVTHVADEGLEHGGTFLLLGEDTRIDGRPFARMADMTARQDLGAETRDRRAITRRALRTLARMQRRYVGRAGFWPANRGAS